MTRYFLAAIALLCSVVAAEATHHHNKATYLAHPDCNVLWPCEGVSPSIRGQHIAKALGGFGSAQQVYSPRVKRIAHKTRHIRSVRVAPKAQLAEPISSYGAPSPSVAYSIARPVRYIAGRLICAINVNAALAERGVKGTGSALAHSFDHWGIRVASPVPGAVAVTDRRGGGHVALVALVEGSRVFVWNPSPRGRGWQLREYTNRHARYRVAGTV